MFALIASLAMLISYPDFQQPAFDTQRAAMAAAARAAEAASSDFESGGAIYRSADGYHYTIPVSSQNERAIDYRVRLPEGARLVALYHTHVLRICALDFSDSDKALQRSMHVPMYAVAIPYHRVIAIGATPFSLE